MLVSFEVTEKRTETFYAVVTNSVGVETVYYASDENFNYWLDKARNVMYCVPINTEETDEEEEYEEVNWDEYRESFSDYISSYIF